MNHQSSSRRDFLVLGSLAAASGALTLRADAHPTPATEDVHQYVNYLQATSQIRLPKSNPADDR